MPTLTEIATGVDVSNHYLDPEQNEFRLFRYQKEVYAVKYDAEGKPVSSIPMWKSHKEEKHVLPKDLNLGAGQAGVVLHKTEDKAVKTPKYPILKPPAVILNNAYNRNQLLLQQKFLLYENGLDKHFVMGLFNVKNNSSKNPYFMPKLTISETRPTPEEMNEFIYALKKVNDLGFAHPDYYRGIGKPTNLNNAMHTTEGIKLIDLDSGWLDINEDVAEAEDEDEREEFVRLKDQWLLVYNHNQNLPKGLGPWVSQVNKWYGKNRGKALSDNPAAILELYEEALKNGVGLKVPDPILKDLQNQVALGKGESKTATVTMPTAAVSKPAVETKQEMAEPQISNAVKQALEDYKKDPEATKAVLFSAIEQKDIDVVMALVEAGAALSVKNDNGQSALLLVATTWDQESVNEVVSSVDPGQAANVLSDAINNGELTAVRRLVKTDNISEFINYANAKGETPLMLAALKKDLVMAQHLLSAGADPLLKNTEGKTAWDLLAKDVVLQQKFGDQVAHAVNSKSGDCIRKIRDIQDKLKIKEGSKETMFINTALKRIAEAEKTGNLKELHDTHTMLTGVLETGKIDLQPAVVRNHFSGSMHLLRSEHEPASSSDLSPTVGT